ncbi:adhesion G-protein coupled receptor G6-like [Anneissia japonica]|uniref:adhesion G-protein coupled receptor G6-like n=1 Tax=Anneissia japonica TaxID=1529436 RepID=UPI0014259AED|nr:adhesion G-protein coupled receptor G6-like [Anneissia japonica]
MRTLICGRKAIKPKRELLIKRFQNAVAVSVLLGLTWVFGFLAIGSDSSARYVFQVLFCFFNSLQGLFIFVLFCVRQKEIRDEWKRCCKRGDRASRVKYATDTSSKGKVKEHSIPLRNVSNQSTNLSTKTNSQM